MRWIAERLAKRTALRERDRETSSRVWRLRVSAAGMALAGLVLAGGMAPRWIAFAQKVEFEVASVKPATDESGRRGIGLFTYPGGRIGANYVPLEYLITEAFHLQNFQLAGVTRWMREERWDIEAKPPADSPSSHSNPRISKLPPNDEQRQMLKALLEDRFQLKWHRETREGPVYFLVKTSKEPKVIPAKDSEAYPWVGSVAGGGISGDGLAATNAPMSLVAERLSGSLGRPLIDRTEMPGAFDFKYPLPKSEPPLDLISSIFASLQGLGFKLEAGKGAVETVVIESAERPKAN